MTSLAPFLPRPAAPPSDARFLALGSPHAWPFIHAERLDTGRPDTTLTLAPLPGALSIGAADGSLGGLVAPRTLALAEDSRHVLLDPENGQILLFEPCRCAFSVLPCFPSRRQDAERASAVLLDGARLYIAVGGARPRVLVYARQELVLRAEWQPPKGAVGAAWQPGQMALAHGLLHVADAANGVIHRFNRTGEHLGIWPGFGSLAAMATDACGDPWIVRAGENLASRLDDSGKEIASTDRLETLAPLFPPPRYRLLADGSFVLGDCGALARFSARGANLPPPPSSLLSPAYERHGLLITPALDSGIDSCVWHRISARMSLPVGARVRAWCLSADAPLSDAAVLALPESRWSAQPALLPDGDGLITAPPGRYLWLRLAFEGPGDETPALSRIEVEFPRVTLARMLPGAFRQDPVSADFTDRFVAVMDRPLRDIESRIDHHAALYDPASAPAGKGSDMLSFIARWLGLRFESRWPEARRRRLLGAMSSLLYRRGTPEALRQAIFAYLGWAEPAAQAQRTRDCPPRCGLKRETFDPRPLILLEHWRLRRWLFLGAGRLGDEARLWGSAILDKVRLDLGARVGASQLNSVHDALRDPFHVAAHRITLFLPARLAQEAGERAALERFVEQFRPAHVAASYAYVAPRMRVGLQASIGFDTVIARYPRATTRLGDMRLGRGSLTPVPPRDAPARLGRDAALHPAVLQRRLKDEGSP